MSMTEKERKALQRERDRAAGYVRAEIRCRPEHRELLQRVANALAMHGGSPGGEIVSVRGVNQRGQVTSLGDLASADEAARDQERWGRYGATIAARGQA